MLKAKKYQGKSYILLFILFQADSLIQYPRFVASSDDRTVPSDLDDDRDHGMTATATTRPKPVPYNGPLKAHGEESSASAHITSKRNRMDIQIGAALRSVSSFPRTGPRVNWENGWTVGGVLGNQVVRWPYSLDTVGAERHHNSRSG